MKKFDPEKEIKKKDFSFANRAFIPMLVIGCVCMALVGVAFSFKLEEDETLYNIDVEIYNGETEELHFNSKEGTFTKSINSYGEFAGIDCETGYMEYDQFTQTISIPYLNTNTKCSIFFREESAKYLSIEGMYSINDDDGTSYYYRADATNNYVKLNDIMFRIVRINGDGSLRLILDDNSLVFNYGTNNKYLDSNIKNVVNNWFNENIKLNNLVISNTFDINNYSEIEDDNLINLDGSYDSFVGTLNAREASLMLEGAKDSFLGNMLLANPTLDGKVLAIVNNEIVTVSVSENMVIKPVINIKNVDLSGFGTIDDPYIPKED